MNPLTDSMAPIMAVAAEAHSACEGEWNESHEATKGQTRRGRKKRRNMKTQKRQN